METAENKIIRDDFSGRLSRLGDIPEMPRLGKIREDILDAEYHVCTQKASLLTEWMAGHYDEGNPLVKVLKKAHFQAFRKTVEAAATSEQKQKPFQISLNNALNRYYIKREGADKSSLLVAYARALAYILERMELKIYDHELIVGNPSSCRVGAPLHPDLGGIIMLPEIEGISERERNPMAIEASQVKELKEEIFPYWFNKSVMSCAPLYTKNGELFNIMLEGALFVLTQFAGVSHVTPDYPTVLELGFSGIKSKVGERIAAVKTEIACETDDKKAGSLREQLAFLEAAEIACDAAIAYGERWSGHCAEKARAEKDPARKKELEELAGILKRVPAGPATTFYEAVQSVFMTHVILHQESFQHGISFGRMDRYLYPFYENDLKRGAITPERAVEIIGCFLGKAGELLPLFFDRATEYFSGLSSASGITLGGETVNDLSYLFLQAYDQIRLRQPNLHVRVTPTTPQDFLDLCCDVLKKGGGIPAFFNDEKIVPTLVGGGISEKDAGDYSIVGCVEWGVPGRSFPAAGAVFINLAMALHLALYNGEFNGRRAGVRTGSLESMRSMNDILRAFRLQLSHMVWLAVDGNNAIEKAHACHRPAPFLSTVVDGCIDKAKEVNDGGATYNSTGCQGVGLADVVDSLAAIDRIVFTEKKMSLAEFIEAVDADFKGFEKLRAWLENKAPKYGRNDPVADDYLEKVSSMYTATVLNYFNPRGGRYYPGFWSMTTHQGFGERTPALPSGRMAGEPLSNGASPSNGVDNLGPTALMASASHLDGTRVCNGYALNQKISAEYLTGNDGNVLLNGLVKGYFRMGGMQVQFNILDHKTLIDARDNPERYRDLVVRVSGYSAYFNDLTREMKDELINRTLHQDCCC